MTPGLPGEAPGVTSPTTSRANPPGPEDTPCYSPWPRSGRTLRAADATANALQAVLDLIAADAPPPDVVAAIARATTVARQLVGWPSYEAATRLLSAASGCVSGHTGTGVHPASACDLDAAHHAVQEALRFDGFLPASTHPTPTVRNLAPRHR